MNQEDKKIFNQNKNELIQKLVKEKSGVLLSGTYETKQSQFHLRCSCGYEWTTRAYIITGGSWCPKCAGKTIEQSWLKELQDIAKSKGGECLSDIYLGNKKRLKWRCKDGHEWMATPSNIKKNNQWCRPCWKNYEAGQHTKNHNGLEEAKKIAIERGGKCLSNEYIGNKEKMSWQCEEGHQWEADLSCVKNSKTWCPQCNKNFKENLCREILKDITGYEFPLIKPDWLRSEKGFKMELDGFNEQLNLAFEYHGEQHYREIPYFTDEKKTFEQRVRYDKLKEETCKKNNVKLIVIPYTVSVSKLPAFIYKEIKKLMPNLELKKIIELESLEPRETKYLKKIKEIAQQRKVELVTPVFYGMYAKYFFKCDKGHKMEGIPLSMKRSIQPYCKECRKIKV